MPEQFFNQDAILTLTGATSGVVMITTVAKSLFQLKEVKWVAITMALIISTLTALVDGRIPDAGANHIVFYAWQVLLVFLNAGLIFCTALGFNFASTSSNDGGSTAPLLDASPKILQRWW